MLTAYSFQMARILAKAGIDILLVGDSVGMVIYGDENTRSVTLEEMIRHGQAVVNGVKSTESEVIIVVDMPAGTYENEDQAVLNCRKVFRSPLISIQYCPWDFTSISVYFFDFRAA